MQALDEIRPTVGKARDLLVRSRRGERAIWIWHLMTGFKGCFGDVGRTAAINLPQVRAIAAPALAARAKGLLVR